MNVALEQHADRWLIRLEGEVTLARAEELKALLLRWLAEGRDAGKNLELDLERAEEIDITIMQMIWAAAREGTRAGLIVGGHASDAVVTALRDTGFDQAPGFPFQAES